MTTVAELRAIGWPQRLSQLLADKHMAAVFSKILGPVPRQLIIDILPELIGGICDTDTIHELHSRYGFEPEEIASAANITKNYRAAVSCLSMDTKKVRSYINVAKNPASDVAALQGMTYLTPNELRFVIYRLNLLSEHSAACVKCLIAQVNNHSSLVRQSVMKTLSTGQLARYRTLVQPVLPDLPPGRMIVLPPHLAAIVAEHHRPKSVGAQTPTQTMTIVVSAAKRNKTSN